MNTFKEDLIERIKMKELVLAALVITKGNLKVPLVIKKTINKQYATVERVHATTPEMVFNDITSMQQKLLVGQSKENILSTTAECFLPTMNYSPVAPDVHICPISR
eukprot:12714-Ditylum_brightwellii.AAC.1